MWFRVVVVTVVWHPSGRGIYQSEPLSNVLSVDTVLHGPKMKYLPYVHNVLLKIIVLKDISCVDFVFFFI